MTLSPIGHSLAVVRDLVVWTGQVTQGAYGYVLDGRLNDSFKAVNLLLDRNVNVRRVDRASGDFQPGDFIVARNAPADLVATIAGETGVSFNAANSDASGVSHRLTRQRIGLFQRYRGGNMDEGWTRLMLEMFSFPYDTLMDARIRQGDLNDDYDVIVLPADGVAGMTGEPQEDGGGGFGGGSDDESIPPDYRSGFGQEGVDALEEFVENGGTLVTFAQAGSLAIEKFGLPIRNVVGGLSSTEFWSPGSTLKVTVDNTNPLAYGMPEDALAIVLARNQVYHIYEQIFIYKEKHNFTFKKENHNPKSI